MSYTTVFIVHKNGSLDDVETLRNAWGFAARIWSHLQKTYLPDGSWIFNPEPVWRLDRDPRLPTHQKLVLMSAFDHAIIEWDHLPEMAEAFAKFATDFPNPGNDHLPALADLFRKIHADPVYKEALGVAFQATSVSEDLWEDYDVLKDDAHFFVFAELERLRKEQDVASSIRAD